MYPMLPSSTSLLFAFLALLNALDAINDCHYARAAWLEMNGSIALAPNATNPSACCRDQPFKIGCVNDRIFWISWGNTGLSGNISTKLLPLLQLKHLYIEAN